MSLHTKYYSSRIFRKLPFFIDLRSYRLENTANKHQVCLLHCDPSLIAQCFYGFSFNRHYNISGSSGCSHDVTEWPHNAPDFTRPITQPHVSMIELNIRRERSAHQSDVIRGRIKGRAAAAAAADSLPLRRPTTPRDFRRTVFRRRRPAVVQSKMCASVIWREFDRRA